MPAAFAIRTSDVTDAAACAEIYAPYVISTAITFEIEAPTASQMAERIAAATRQHAWLVLEDDGVVAGYAYAHAFAARAAYRWACETSIYLEMGRRRTGAGRALYAELFARLADRGYRRAIAGMTLPNDASVGLHTAVGFEPMGVYRQIGWKNNGWHDVAWVQKTISHAPDPPAEPR
ncbi:MAG TPA: GNAT family N-acetyltransferase [Frankiaceae bacterium]|nr:GNAT family N-acetyltransferase [Frankiaceae bacterium]